MRKPLDWGKLEIGVAVVGTGNTVALAFALEEQPRVVHALPACSDYLLSGIQPLAQFQCQGSSSPCQPKPWSVQSCSPCQPKLCSVLASPWRHLLKFQCCYQMQLTLQSLN
eukprot:scpid105064/ scgid18736/ 